MFGRHDLRELAEYRSDTMVLSIYLNADPTQRTTDEYKLALRQLLKEVEDRANSEDIKAVERFIDLEYDWKGRGIAIFSCAEDGFWRQYSLAVPVQSRASVSPKPFVTPLASLWDTYGRFTVALVDRQGARLMLFQMGDVIATEGMVGDEVRRIKKGGGSSATARRGGAGGSAKREEEVAARNLREAAELTVAFCETHRPRNLLLGAAEPTLSQFKDRLPQVWADRVIGSFSADMTANEHDIRTQAFEILERVDHEQEMALADAVITAAAKGSNGVIRLDDVLGAVHAGRVQTLLVAEGYHAPGYHCDSCGYVTAQHLDQCPFCGGDIVETRDAVDDVISHVLEFGGRVEVISGHEGLEEAGIGALLRY